MLATAASYYIKLWDLNYENDIVAVKEKSSCMPHGSSNVLCMEWTQDSSLIGTAGSDGCLVLCIPDTGIFSEVIPTGRLKNSKNDEIHSLKFYNKSNLIVFGGSGQIIKCWDRQHKKFLNNYTGHKKTIISMDINQSESNVSSVSENGDILINSLETKASILRNITENTLNKIIYSKNSNSKVFTIDNHGFLYSYDTINLITDNKIQISNLSINDITISSQNNTFVTANEDGTLAFIDTQSKNIVNTYKVNDPITAVSMKDSSSILACGTSRGQVLLYDIRMNKQLHKYWAETKAIQTLSFQKVNNDNVDNSHNRKRTQSNTTLDNNKINPKKHMLSSESDTSDDLNNKANDLNINTTGRLKFSSPTPSIPLNVTISTPTNNNGNNNNNTNNITSDILSAFSSKKHQSQTTNIFSSNVNQPFDYSFSKSRPKYINNISSENNTFINDKNTSSTTTANKNNSSILKFSEFLKNHSYSRVNSKNSLFQDSNITTPTNTKKSNDQSTFITPKMKEISIQQNEINTTTTTTTTTNNDKNKDKNNEKDTNMEVDTTVSFNNIWLNPEVFSGPNDTSIPSESTKLSTSSTSSIEKGPTTKSGLTMPSQLNSNSMDHLDESLYEQYIDENTNILREKLQKNIKDELQKKGVSISNDNDIENDKSNEGIPSISNKILENAVDEGLQELKGFLRNDIKNMHLEIIGQFHFQKYEIEKMFKEQQEKIGPLLRELQKLREENERLKYQFYKR